MKSFAATRLRSVLVFKMALVEKSTVPSRDALLVLLCRKALTQKEGRIREDENRQTEVPGCLILGFGDL